MRPPLLALVCLLLSFLATPRAEALPGGRAYEMVTPVDKNGGDVGGPGLEGEFASALGQSSTDGNSISYASLSSFGDAQSAELFTTYISSRQSDGWSTHAISPPAAVPARFFGFSPFHFFASDLSASLLEWAEPALAEGGAPPGFENLYVRGSDGTYRVVIDVAPPNLQPGDFQVAFAGASPDLGHVVFEANDSLAPGAPVSTRSVYEWTGSALRLVSVLPGGVAAASARAGDGSGEDLASVISSDGSRIFWTDGEKQLYVREDGVRTVKLNASQRAASLGDGTATLLAATPDGSNAVFTDETALTDEPNDNGGGLYQYDLEAGGLRDLTPYAGGAPGVQGVLGMSDDGSTVYFVASAALADGASGGAMNLYVVRGGAIEFIAALSGNDRRDWTRSLELRTARVTPDGAHAAFLSEASLTGYDNTDAITGNPHRELFVFDVDESRLTCVSCNPEGARPIGDASMPIGTSPSYQPRVISDDGSRVVFNSDDALVAADGNDRQDVYLYEDGRPRLISTGTSGDISALVDMSPGGRDVFFTTRARLVAADRDSGSDIYDARVGGGFPAAAEEGLPCAGEACRGPLSGPALAGLAVASARGGEPGLRGASKRRARCRARPVKASRAKRPKRCGKRGGRG